jgi:hypothetical protein
VTADPLLLAELVSLHADRQEVISEQAAQPFGDPGPPWSRLAIRPRESAQEPPLRTSRTENVVDPLTSHNWLLWSRNACSAGYFNVIDSLRAVPPTLDS